MTDETTDLLYRPHFPMGHKCNHQFVPIQQTEKFRAGTTRVEKVGVQCGCPHCGEVRTIWDNGDIDIKVPPHEYRTNTTTKDNGKHPIDHQVD